MPTNPNQPDPVLAMEVIAMVNMNQTIAPPNAQSGANSAITAKFLTSLHLYVDRNHLNQPILLLLRFIMSHNRTHIRIAPVQDINETQHLFAPLNQIIVIITQSSSTYFPTVEQLYA